MFFLVGVGFVALPPLACRRLTKSRDARVGWVSASAVVDSKYSFWCRAYGGRKNPGNVLRNRFSFEKPHFWRIKESYEPSS